MQKKDVQIGGTYWANVSGRRVKVKLLNEVQLLSGRVGWNAKNLATGRTITIRSAQRLTPLQTASMA
jgi:hypothetical protein